MSPVSCLIRFPSTEKPKKRVRFTIDSSVSGDAMLTLERQSPKGESLLPGVTCPEAGPSWCHTYGTTPNTADWLQKPRWWRDKVSRLRLVAPLTVLPSVSVEDAISIMDSQGYDQLPVVDAVGYLCGVATLKSLATALLVCRVQTTSPVWQAMDSEYDTVTRTGTLGALCEILEERDFVLVVHVQRQLTAAGEGTQKEVVIGIVTRIDLLNHVVSSHTA